MQSTNIWNIISIGSSRSTEDFAMRAGIFTMSCLIGWLAVLSAQDAVNKMPVPDAASVAKGQKAVQEIFGRDIENVKTVAGRKALAARMLGAANDAKAPTENRWVLYLKARDMAVDAGDVSGTMQIVDDLQKAFSVDSKVIAETVEKLAKNAAAAGTMPLFEFIEKAADEAFQVDDYKNADRLLTAGNRAAQNAKDTLTAKHFEARSRRAKELAKDYDDVAGIDLHVAMFQCFRKGDWAKGLPLLVNSQDDALVAVAKTDLTNPLEAMDRIVLGDSWWGLAEKKKGPYRLGMLRRAFSWYRLGVVGLEGANKAKVEGRMHKILEELDREAGGRRRRWVYTKGEYKMISPGEWQQKFEGNVQTYHETERMKDYVELQMLDNKNQNHIVRLFSTQADYKVEPAAMFPQQIRGKWVD